MHAREHVCLADVLGLRPLDRVQVNNAREISEMRVAPQLGYEAELPFLYFQRVLEDGMLEVRSPGGYDTKVSPEDICDVRKSEPLIVRALTRRAFLDRTRLSWDERNNRPPSEEDYAEANVLYVTKDRWNRVDCVYVWFIDHNLNERLPWNASIHANDQQMLAAKAKRACIPVMTVSNGGGYSADKGLVQEKSLVTGLVDGLFKCALRGNDVGVATLTMAGASMVSRASLNRLVNQMAMPV